MTELTSFNKRNDGLYELAPQFGRRRLCQTWILVCPRKAPEGLSGQDTTYGNGVGKREYQNIVDDAKQDISFLDWLKSR